LYRDNVPSVLLGEWEVEADYLDDDFSSGLLPVLFAEDPDASNSGLLSDPDNTRKDLERLNRVFFIPETVSLEEAFRIVNKPRLGDVDYYFRSLNLDRVFAHPIFRVHSAAPGTMLHSIIIS